MTSDDDTTLSETLRLRTAALVESMLARTAAPRTVQPSESLSDAGITSLDMVNLMLAVEAEFDIFIPSDYVNPTNFRSVASIARMVENVRSEAPSTV